VKLEEADQILIPQLHGGGAHTLDLHLPGIVADGADAFVVNLEGYPLGSLLQDTFFKVGVINVDTKSERAAAGVGNVDVLLGADHGQLSLILGHGGTADELLDAGLSPLGVHVVSVGKSQRNGLDTGVPGTPALAVGVDDTELIGVLGELDVAVYTGGNTRVVQDKGDIHSIVLRHHDHIRFRP